MICLMTAWRQHERVLRAWFVRRLGDGHTADDLLQELCIKALGRNRQFCERLGEHLATVCQVRLDETGRVCCFVPRPPPVALL